jgi:hypothetical protein
MNEQYYHTRNTKLAVALATMGVPFHNPNEPVMSVKVAAGSSVKVESIWRFALTGTWTNRDSSLEHVVSSDDIGKTWSSPNAPTNLPREAVEELMIIKRGLEARDLLLQAFHALDKSPKPDVRYVQDALEWNAELLRKVLAEQAVLRLTTRNGKFLYVPERDAREHAQNAAKAFGVRL